MIRTDVDSLVVDLAVAADSARRGGLRDPAATTSLAADAIDTAVFLEAVAVPNDPAPQLLRQAGSLLARLADRTKSARLRRARTKLDVDEMTKIKSATTTPPPSQAELAASLDRVVWDSQGPSFDRSTFEDIERRRVEEQNRQLAAQNEQAAERAAQVAETEPEVPYWRR